MKIKGLLISMLACTVLVGCTSDDVVENNEQTLEKGKAFMGVRIELPSDGLSSRGSGTTDGGYLNSTTEHAIKTIAFVFYTDGAYYGQSFNNAVTDTDQATGNVESIAETVVALETQEKTFPNQVVAFANVYSSATEAETALKDKRLTEAYAITTSKINGQTDDLGFIMTNSTYLSGGNIITATSVNATNFYEQDHLAIANPVDMYIERVAAKIIAKEATDINIEDIPTADNNVKLKFKVENFTLNASNKTSYLLKNIDDTWNFGANWVISWNNANDYRCFWAKDPNYTDGKYNLNAFENDDEEGDNNVNPTDNSLNYYSYGENTISEAGIYCLENTFEGTPNTNPFSYGTHVLVNGQYYNGEKKLRTFYYYGSLAYEVTEDNEVNSTSLSTDIPDQEEFRTRLAEATKCFYTLNADGKTHSAYTIDADNIEIVRAKKEGADDVTIAFKDTFKEYNTLYVENNGTYTQITSLAAANQAILDWIGTADMYKQGKGYFAVLIDHFGKDGNVGEHGVVRNHLYELTINSIRSMATGNVDPNEPIIPEGDKKTYYLGATLKILSWKKVQQGVDL